MFFRYFFNFFCWNTRINTIGFYNRVFQNNRSSCNYGVTSYYHMVHYNSTHPNQNIVFYGATMHNGIVSYRYIISNGSFGFFVGAMHTSAILNIYFVTDTNFVYITTNNTTKPYTTFLTNYYISNNSCIWSDKTIRCNLWGNASCRKNNRHTMFFGKDTKRTKLLGGVYAKLE